ncbi:hypothetical protein ACFXHA_38895 [Nocardia sp. NPDC059240]|uniref:hypothetical protein n=1 Tax=Nocardia sp. NPDC059240 TaxID=3346786 RepID=UPI0036ABBDEB
MSSSELGQALADIRAEREAHVTKGYDAEHDRLHGVGRLVELAAQYAGPTFSRRELVKAASLLVAAIEVIDR